MNLHLICERYSQQVPVILGADQKDRCDFSHGQIIDLPRPVMGDEALHHIGGISIDVEGNGGAVLLRFDIPIRFSMG